ncbi:Retrovirus-related Pol polyprotein from transposon 17.6 [Pyrus ussuriensis x Pyrus communis]|uniref:Retrovirus-related Pol polyprotein from transposon 17.6 n=1 Tax=Pyrus ussuriensis x Pyrus communis TaxID=2448454 RepID=A0A5N5HIR9_9ROSA|nr:Retrovirus-related Pol polyprotein from transposon 17.6 [Pyrus ussuriensis x Pyrus communis]
MTYINHRRTIPSCLKLFGNIPRTRKRHIGPSTQSYDTPWPQAEGWNDEDRNIMNLVQGCYDEVFTIKMPDEYIAGTSLRQQACQKMATVTLYDFFDIETKQSSTTLPKRRPTAAQVIQRNQKFKSLFDELEYGPKPRTATTKALMHIFPRRAFLENKNVIAFTDEDMEVVFPDHRNSLYLEGQTMTYLFGEL